MRKGMLIILSLFLFACSAAIDSTPTSMPTLEPTPTRSCQELVKGYLDAIDPILTRWDDASALASSTSRISLSGPVSDLQAIRREVSNILPPDCAIEAHTALTEYMDASIESFLAFMANEPDSRVNAAFNYAQSRLGRWNRLLESLSTGDSSLVETDKVVYMVNGQLITQAEVTYDDETGQRHTREVIDLPWTLSLDMPTGGGIYLSAKNLSEDGKISCEITINGIHHDSADSNMRFGIATCSPGQER